MLNKLGKYHWTVQVLGLILIIALLPVFMLVAPVLMWWEDL